MWPVNLCERCDGYGAGFSVDHALRCRKGGLVCQRHDDTRDEAGSLAANALTASHVSYEPHIFYGRGVSAGGLPPIRILQTILITEAKYLTYVPCYLVT